MTLESHQVKDGYRPTFEDLRRRAEEGGYGGGRGKMDTREWYELCYFEVLEDFIDEALMKRYEMVIQDAVVCRNVWIYDHSVDTARYDDVVDRICRLGLSESDEAAEGALTLSIIRGYVIYNDDNSILSLRQDIEQFLSELVDKICAENDANIAAKHGMEAVEELQKLHAEKLLEFEQEWIESIEEQQQEEDSGNGRGSG